VPSYPDPGDDRPDTASSRLNAGLRSCRAVLSNYRALLAEDSDQLSDQAVRDGKGSADQNERRRTQAQGSEPLIKT
jgi:hypothetical protein